MGEAIRVEALTKRFGRLQVLRGIDCVIHDSEVVCVIGPSGSGKSTLLRCVNGLEEAMQTLADEGMTMVVVTHEMGFARRVAHRVLFLDEGQLVEEGAPADLFERPVEARTQRFLSNVL